MFPILLADIKISLEIIEKIGPESPIAKIQIDVYIDLCTLSPCEEKSFAEETLETGMVCGTTRETRDLDEW